MPTDAVRPVRDPVSPPDQGVRDPGVLDPAVRASAVRALDWFTRPPATSEDDGRFLGGELNLCFNALDRHVIRGLADEPALRWTGENAQTFSYAHVLQQVAQLGGALRELGVQTGDRVLSQLSDPIRAVFALLAGARVGAAGVLLSRGTADVDLVARLDETTPTVVIGTPATIGALDRAEHRPDWSIVDHGAQPTPPPGSDDRQLALAWLMKPGSFEPAACVEVPSATVVTILADGPREHGPYGVALTAALGADELGVGQVVRVEDSLSSRSSQDRLWSGLLAGATVELGPTTPHGTRHPPRRRCTLCVP